MKQWYLYVLAGLLGFLIVNIAWINWWMTGGGGRNLRERVELAELRLDSVIKRDVGGGTVTVVQEPTGSEGDGGVEVVEIVNEDDLRELELRVEELENTVADLSSDTPTSATTTTSSTSQVREFFVPLGSGSTFSKDWVDIPTAQATVDSSRYGQIEAVYFEASLHVINGNVSARLVDASNGAIYTNTEIAHNNSTPTWVTSSSITLGTGERTYKVQLRSDGGWEGILDSGRLRILVK